MEMISLDGESTLDSLDEDSITRFAEHEAALFHSALHLGGGKLKSEALLKNLNSFVESLEDKDAHYFLSIFEPAYASKLKKYVQYDEDKAAAEKKKKIITFAIFFAASISIYFMVFN